MGKKSLLGIHISFLYLVLIVISLFCSCSSEENVYSDLSTNKISFKATVAEKWNNVRINSIPQQIETTRNILNSNEQGPLIVRSGLGIALYLHPVTQIGIHIQTANDKPITKSGKVIIDESDGKTLPTRGVPNTSSVLSNSFGILAYRTSSSATGVSGVAPDFINDQEVTASGNLWKTGTDYFWPDDGDKLSFFAYTPFGNSDIIVADASSTGTPSITYTANADVMKQQDLMVASKQNQTRSTTSIAAGVDMPFSHALTAITFAVGKDMVPGVFKSIAIKGAITTATYNLNTNTWNTSSGTNRVNIRIMLNGTTGKVVDGTENVALTSGTNTMMMIPQTFSSSSTAYIEAVFNYGNGDKTLTASLAGATWDAGTSIIYKLSTSSVNTLTLGTISYPSSWGGTAAPVSNFCSGETAGIYVVDQNNRVKGANIKATYNGSSWTLASNILFSPQYKYFAYYPYRSGYSSSSVTAAATTADEFFAGIISSWTVSADQSTANKFKVNDLQVAMGTISSTASSISFDMAHKMGLAIITLGTKSIPTTRTYTVRNSMSYSDSSDKTAVTASSNFSGNSPFLYNSKYYYIAKAATNTTFNSVTTDNNAWSMTQSVSSGAYGSLTAITTRAFYKFIAKFNYIGNVQSLTIPLTGIYKLEAWGAQGTTTPKQGNMTSIGYGGLGGYAVCQITKEKESNLFICVGKGGESYGNYSWFSGSGDAHSNPTAYRTRIYNGGGAGHAFGGGATHIALTNRGELYNYENYKSEILIVAGGGGGNELISGNAGAGGGLNGGSGYDVPTFGCTGYGGTQTAGGLSGAAVTNSQTYGAGKDGAFGLGGNSYISYDIYEEGAGGGGGWYGGGASTCYAGTGGGGSGYVNSSLTNNSTIKSGVREGDGYAIITLITPD
jgi:hypothetical protein